MSERQPDRPSGPTMRCYPVDGGRHWAAALKSASGQLETLAALFDTAEEAKAYTARANEALAARQRRLGPLPRATLAADRPISPKGETKP